MDLLDELKRKGHVKGWAWMLFVVPLLLSPLLAACADLPAAQPQGQPPASVTIPPAVASTPTSASAAPAEAPRRAASGALRTAPFGGERWGFVEMSSANGRFVVLRRFAGDAKPTFAQHGESSSPPSLAVFDRFADTERVLDDLIDIDPSRRWLLVLDQGQVWLADAQEGAFRPLDKADMSRDINRCMPPSQAGFSPKGRRVAWVTGNAEALRVRDLGSGEEWSIKAKDRLWRGWPDDDGRGAILAETPAGTTDWPLQRTSCACRWCNRFAMSYGFYGWSGPAFAIEHVAEDGSRAKASPPKGEGRWHGKTESGCALVPKSEENNLERGPWQWKCPATP